MGGALRSAAAKGGSYAPELAMLQRFLCARWGARSAAEADSMPRAIMPALHRMTRETGAGAVVAAQRPDWMP